MVRVNGLSTRLCVDQKSFRFGVGFSKHIILPRFFFPISHAPSHCACVFNLCLYIYNKWFFLRILSLQFLLQVYYDIFSLSRRNCLALTIFDIVLVWIFDFVLPFDLLCFERTLAININ